MPQEVIAATLDPRTRRWFLSTYGDTPPLTTTEAGWLSLYSHIRRSRTTDELPPEDVPTPEKIAYFLDAVLDLTGRIDANFNAAKANLSHHHGLPTAERWHAAQVEALRSAAQHNKRIKFVTIGVIALLVIVPIAVAVVLVAAALAR